MTEEFVEDDEWLNIPDVIRITLERLSSTVNTQGAQIAKLRADLADSKSAFNSAQQALTVQTASLTSTVSSRAPLQLVSDVNKQTFTHTKYKYYKTSTLSIWVFSSRTQFLRTPFVFFPFYGFILNTSRIFELP